MPGDDPGRPEDDPAHLRSAGPLVGVLGGMGPAATADFYTRLVRETPATTDQDHLRVLLWCDPTVPDRSRALLEGGTDPTPWLLRGARVLAAAGSDVIAVPCNTAHAFLPAVAEEAGVPLVHMTERTGRYLARHHPSVRRVGLLATTGTLRTKLYDGWLTDAGISVLEPDPVSQADEVMAAIRSIKAGETSSQLLRTAARRLVGRGAQAVIAGCSEVPLGLDSRDLLVPLIDPVQVLVRTLVALHLSARASEPRRDILDAECHDGTKYRWRDSG
ncbi:aspartate/glutamate racemase family protein [Amycolatopsis decaplanina]|nr:amino acid racemase [Amycolatopsis decaplanina]